MGLWVVFLLLSDLSTEFDAFERWFIEILQDPMTVTYYIYTLGSIVAVGVLYIFWNKYEK
jgi:hypothetical protein